MLLIEADGKALFAEHGIAVPNGVVLTEPTLGDLPGAGPWIVKAQVPIGGRGKAGGIVRCESRLDVVAALDRMLGSRLKGHQVHACLVEEAISGDERYLAIMVDAANYGLRVVYSSDGGVDIEQSGFADSRLCAPHAGQVGDAVLALAGNEPEERRDDLRRIAVYLAAMLIARGLALVEINPLFLSETGWVAGDAKVIVDLNRVEQEGPTRFRVASLIESRPGIYADANRKLREGFDYVELDPQGEIGLVTTGAGLSMMLIDELAARGGKPLNFCDIRTGQMRGSPVRLMRVLDWIASRPSLRVVLVNIFAGITDLAEFATLLATAIDGTPSLRVPVVARLVGRNAEDARRILAEHQPNMLVTEDLEEALRQVVITTETESPSPLAGGGWGDAAERTTTAVIRTPPPIPLPQREGESSTPSDLPILSTLSRATPVIVQGITGRMGRTHAALMRAYGTNIVGGTSTRADVTEAAGVPVFPDCAAAVAATGAIASVVMAPPAETLAAVDEALAAGIKLFVTIAEGVPLHDAIRIGQTARAAGATWIGASTPGVAIPGEVKLGFLPDAALRPGPLAIMTKSGTLSYEVGYRLARQGIGQSIWVGVGGDPVKGVRFSDLLPVFFADSRTHGIILVGEVGGTEEEECADALCALGLRKPVYVLIAGREAKEGVAMGHAGALVHGDSGTLAAKTRRLTEAGARCFASIEALVQACVADFGMSGDYQIA